MHEEPVEILVAMAERGEIDPWNIDIVEVTDRFLEELERMRELDLRISGRTLFFAATLLRMKSEYFEEEEDADEGDFFEEGEDFGDDFDFEDDFALGGINEPIERLEREIKRRIGRKKQRKRPVTLYELIKELKTAEKEERRRTRRRVVAPPLLIEADEVVGIAHEENFQDASDTVMRCFETVEAREKRVTLDDLCSEMGCNLRDVYIPLLFLMIESKLVLFQDEFFGELTIEKWRADAFSGE
jgi:segregation and condensation protein A